MTTVSASVAFIVLSLMPFHQAFAQTPAPYIESIAGTEEVDVDRNGAATQAVEGDELQEKDRVKTGADNSVRITYPDGSAVIMGSSTVLEVEAPDGGASSAQLISGTIQAVVAKQKGAQNSGSPHKFFIKTDSAVMGVRGTEFVVENSPGTEGTSLHTLDGTVDVGKDVQSVRNGQGSAVTKNQMIEANGKGISQPRAFDRRAFMQRFRKTHPRVAAIAARRIHTRIEVQKRRHWRERRRKNREHRH